MKSTARVKLLERHTPIGVMTWREFITGPLPAELQADWYRFTTQSEDDMSVKSRLAILEALPQARPQEPEPTTDELIAALERAIGCEIPHTAEAASELLGHPASIMDAAAKLAGAANGAELLDWLGGKK